MIYGSMDCIFLSQDGKYVVVAGITPTPLGEGKSTTTIGLVQVSQILFDDKLLFQHVSSGNWVSAEEKCVCLCASA